MLRTIGLFLLLAALVMEHVPVMDFGHAMSFASDLVNDADDTDTSVEDLVKDDAKDPLEHGHWNVHHAADSGNTVETMKSYHLSVEPDPIHFDVPTPPPLC